MPAPFIHQVACEELEEDESEQEGFVNYARRVGRRIVALESIGQHGTWEAYQRKPKEVLPPNLPPDCLSRKPCMR